MRSWLGVIAAAALVAGGCIAAIDTASASGLAAGGGGAAAHGTAPSDSVAAGGGGASVHGTASSGSASAHAAGAFASGVGGGAAAGAGRAGALAWHLVGEMRFPAGTRPASLPGIPMGLRDGGPPGSHWARAVRFLVAPVGPAAVWAVLLPHKPFDDAGSMGAAGDEGPVGTSALIPAPAPGITAAIASVMLEPWHNGTTLIAAYGYATARPARTAAEQLNPRAFRAVTVTATTVIPGQRTVRRTFTSSSVIAGIAAFLNARPTAPDIPVPCPMPATSYRAAFGPAVRGGPAVTVTESCMTDQIAVNGHDQPLVWDTHGGLAKLLGKLTHTGP